MVFLNLGTAEDPILIFCKTRCMGLYGHPVDTAVLGACADEAPVRGRRYFGNTSNTAKAPCGARGAYDLRVVIASEAYDHNAQRKTLESFVFAHPPLPFSFKSG